MLFKAETLIEAFNNNGFKNKSKKMTTKAL